MSRGARIIAALLLMFGLVAVRLYENDLFYDPLLRFFETDHTIATKLPEMNQSRLVGFTILRFLINTLLSLGILWLVFQKRDVVVLSSVLYGIAFVVLGILFVWMLAVSENGSYRTLFYIRRFLIQPIFLLVLLPAFYFQKRST